MTESLYCLIRDSSSLPCSTTASHCFILCSYEFNSFKLYLHVEPTMHVFCVWLIYYRTIFFGFFSVASKWLNFLLFMHKGYLPINRHLGHLYMIAITNYAATNIRMKLFLFEIPTSCSLDTDTEMELLDQMGILFLFFHSVVFPNWFHQCTLPL